MLRITTSETESLLSLKVEGRLAGPWVNVLRDCWQHQQSAANGRTIEVDLRAVSYADAAGIDVLAEMSRRDARLIAGDCEMSAILGEIRHAPVPAAIRAVSMTSPHNGNSN